MSVISKDGVDQVNQHVKNPLVNIYDKLSSSNPTAFNLIKDEFDHIMDFVNKVNGDWVEPGGDTMPTVIVNNRPYVPVD